MGTHDRVAVAESLLKEGGIGGRNVVIGEVEYS